ICFKVVRYSDASFVEDQDQWWFGGIHRSVYVYSTEHTFIQDIEALTKIEKVNDDDYVGIIPLVVTLGHSDKYPFDEKNNEYPTNEVLDNLSRTVQYTVYPLEGSPSALQLGKKLTHGMLTAHFDYRNTLNQVREMIHLPKVDLWSHETPNLYVVLISLYEKKSNDALRHIESTSCTIGFKSVEICNRELRFNGKMIYIHGVNRHEHNEFNGKTLSTKEMLKDIYLLKQYNFNAVRTCHYPDDERWYDLCDRYGIYVLDEANIENHAYYDGIPRSDEWAYAYMTRVQRMVRRDKNHACIFGWSLGNESGEGANHIACQAWIRHIDPTRIVHYEGFVRDEWHQGPFTLQSLARGKGLTDLISPMYPSIDLIVEYAKNCDDYRPIIMCEYSHAMGNSNGSLADYWHAIEKTHGLQGGFIWDWIDQGIARGTQEENTKDWLYGGDFADEPTDYDFCLNGLLFPDQTPKPAMEECKKLFAPVRLHTVHAQQGIFEVENRYDFITLETLSLEWQIISNGTTIYTGVIMLSPIQPSKKQCITIEEIAQAIQNNTTQELYFIAHFVYNKSSEWAKKGDICSTDSVLISPRIGLQTYPSSAEKTMNNNDLQSIVDSFNPVLFRPLLENEAIKKQLHLIHTDPKPWCFVNKPTIEWLDNDIQHITLVQKDASTWDIMSGKKALKNQVIGFYTKKIISKKNGTFDIEIGFELNNTLSEYPRVGISFPISNDFKTINWYGAGPHENYSDRNYSAYIALHNKNISDMFVPYIVPQESGNRTRTTFVEFVAKDKTLQIQSEQEFTFAVRPYDIDDLFLCHHNAQLTNLAQKLNGHWIFTLDIAHRGVGTGSCGDDTLEAYRLRTGIYKLRFTLQ
ncbi:MAG: glycoside hydrolase family 2 TIM barrel-domain containing protein, partial [Treponemataceae bacterium]